MEQEVVKHHPMGVKMATMFPFFWLYHLPHLPWVNFEFGGQFSECQQLMMIDAQLHFFPKLHDHGVVIKFAIKVSLLQYTTMSVCLSLSLSFCFLSYLFLLFRGCWFFTNTHTMCRFPLFCLFFLSWIVEIVPKVDLARLPQSVSFGLW